jgi:methyl coenzyme M reductase subunit D
MLFVPEDESMGTASVSPRNHQQRAVIPLAGEPLELLAYRIENDV